MAKHIAFQMDHPSRLNPKSDSTFMLIEEAQERGYHCYCYTPQQMSLFNAEVVAELHPITIDTTRTPAWTLGDPTQRSLHSMDMVWMRQDPPFDMAYITATHLLEHVQRDTHVFNHPAGVRNAPEKLSPLQFEQFTPPTLISINPAMIHRFAREQRVVVAKPLYGFGGRGVFKFEAGDPNIDTLIEQWSEFSREPLIWQAFLPEVSTRDTRILLINGEVASVFHRIPAGDSIRANMRVGGVPQKATITPRQQEICDAVAPMLREHGLLLVGLDVIGDVLTEINVTCPTGLRAAQTLYGSNLAAQIWDKAESF